MSTIGPGDLLAINTPVRVGNNFGHVICAAMVPACNGGMICSHTIKFTARRIRGFGSQYKTVPIVGQTLSVSYVAIIVLEAEP